MNVPNFEIHSAVYGRSAVNRMDQSAERSAEGARAALESFYFAFNQKDLAVFDEVWAADPAVQLNNPVGGVLRGTAEIRALYERIFTGPADVWVELHDVAEYISDGCAVFAGRERGRFTIGAVSVPLEIRTTRVFFYLAESGGWRQVHHHGSIDDSELLASYQAAVRGDEAVVVLASLAIRPDAVEAFEAATADLLTHSRREPGVSLFRLHEVPGQAGRYVFFEVFQSEAARLQHFREAHTIRWLAEARTLWVGEPEVQRLEPAAINVR